MGQSFLDEFDRAYGRRPEYCVPVVNRDLATVLLHAFADAHPLSPRGVKEALERVKMVPAASGAPGTFLSFGNWMRRGWVGAGYLVARQLDPDRVNAHPSDASASSDQRTDAPAQIGRSRAVRNPGGVVQTVGMEFTTPMAACSDGVHAWRRAQWT